MKIVKNTMSKSMGAEISMCFSFMVKGGQSRSVSSDLMEQGTPTITDSLVAFNGDANAGEAYATFSVSKEELINGNPNLENRGFGACKTQGKPYDLLVTAALVRLAYYFPTMQISSDGGWPGMWEGSILCQEVFGVGVNPVKKDEDS
jgi:hypothetical protein